MRYLAFDVHGKPAQKGSSRAMIHNQTGRAIVLPDNRKALRSWEGVVRTAASYAVQDAEEASGQPWPMIAEPCCVVLRFRRERPKSRKAGEFPDTAPDLDKLTRAILDALQKTVLEDDKFVKRLLVEEVYADAGKPPGVDVSVYTLPALPTAAWGDATAALLKADDDDVAGF